MFSQRQQSFYFFSHLIGIHRCFPATVHDGQFNAQHQDSLKTVIVVDNFQLTGIAIYVGAGVFIYFNKNQLINLISRLSAQPDWAHNPTGRQSN
jgi:hypothetical protein